MSFQRATVACYEGLARRPRPRAISRSGQGEIEELLMAWFLEQSRQVQEAILTDSPGARALVIDAILGGRPIPGDPDNDDTPLHVRPDDSRD